MTIHQRIASSTRNILNLRHVRFLRAALLPAMCVMCLPAMHAFADANWTGTTSNDWTDSGNWTGPVPSTSSDTATFTNSASNTPTITGGPVNPTTISVGSILFTVNASSFNVNVNGGANGANYASLALDGVGVVNNSASTQQFTVGGEYYRGFLYFNNASSAGSNVIYTVNSAGSLSLGGTSSAGTATFILNDGQMGIYANSITGIGNSIQNNSGSMLDLTGHIGGVTLGSVSGAGVIYLGGLNLDTGGDNSDATIDGVIHDGDFPSGTDAGGSLTKSGTGTLVLTAANEYTGGTIINGGALKLGNGSTSDASVGTGDVTVNASGTFILDLSTNAVFANNIVDNHLVIVDDSPSADYSVSGTISGTGALVKTGANTITLTGNNSYTGGTIVEEGSLVNGAAGGFVNNTAYTVNGGSLDLNSINLSMSSLSGTGGEVILGTATLTVNQAASTSYTGVISGDGQLTKSGAGTLILGGANTYTGDTNINGGLLQVDGSIASVNVNVNAGGALGGTGSLTGNVMNAGTVSPGDSPGTLTIGGNYTQTSAGRLVIQIAGTGAGQHDLLAVGGAAALDGTLQFVRLGNVLLHAGDKIVFLTAAGGRTGTFSSVDTGTLLDAQVIYEPKDVLVEFTQSSFSSFAATSGLTSNQFVVARNLDGTINDPRVQELITFLNNEPLADLPYDLSLIAPEELTAIFGISFSYADVQAANIENHLATVRAEDAPSVNVGFLTQSSSVGLRKDADDKKTMSAPVPGGPRWTVFMEGSGDFVRVNGDLNAAGYNFTTGGVTVGADYHASEHFTIGLMGGYADTGATLTQGGSVDVNSGKVGIYSTIYGNGFYLNTMATGGYNSYDTHRTGLGGIARGNTDGEEFDGLLSGGYDIHAGNFTVGPIASAQYTHVGINNYTEAGSLAPLNIPSQSQQSFRSKVGFKVSSLWHIGGIAVTPAVSAAWQHEYLDSTYALDSRFANGAGGVFTTTGPALGRDSVVVNAGVNVQWTDRFGTYLSYDGELGRKNYQLNSVSGGLKVNF